MNYLDEAMKDKNVSDIIHLLEAYRFEWAIAGGWCRDMIQRKEPKDIDIIIYNVDYISKGQMNDFEKELESMNLTRKGDNNIKSEGQELMQVLAVGVDVPVDLIFWKGKYKTAKEVIARFDTNMNQFILNYKTGDIEFLGENRGVMHLIESDRKGSMTQERLDRMLVVANKLGWDLSKEVEGLAVEGLPKNQDNDVFGADETFSLSP